MLKDVIFLARSGPVDTASPLYPCSRGQWNRLPSWLIIFRWIKGQAWSRSWSKEKHPPMRRKGSCLQGESSILQLGMYLLSFGDQNILPRVKQPRFLREVGVVGKELDFLHKGSRSKVNPPETHPSVAVVLLTRVDAFWCLTRSRVVVCLFYFVL